MEGTAELLAGVDLVELGTASVTRYRQNRLPCFRFRPSGLHSDFPPLKTLKRLDREICDTPTTSIVGRESGAWRCGSCAKKSHRLVTLTGVGGVGKTRLALEVAARTANDFPDGVWLIELAAVGDPAAVPEAEAAVLGIAQQSEMTMAESVAAALEGRSRLLVFDNCEHVLGAAADLVEAILSVSTTVDDPGHQPGRSAGCSDEQLWPIPSLDVRTGSDSAAALLFVERAEAGRAGRLTDGRRRAGGGSGDLPAPGRGSRWESSWLRHACCQ